VCPYGHPVVRQCSKQDGEKCCVSVSKKCPAGLHYSQVKCHQTVGNNCGACKTLAKKKAKDEEELRKAEEEQKSLVEGFVKMRDMALKELLHASQEVSHLQEVDRIKREIELINEELRQVKLGVVTTVSDAVEVQISKLSYGVFTL
jgi:hypothetical protein